MKNLIFIMIMCTPMASNSEEFEAFLIFNKKITELCKLGNPTYFVQ